MRLLFKLVALFCFIRVYLLDYSEKQRGFMADMLGGFVRHMFASGPWRSGKSHSAIRGIVLWAMLYHGDGAEIAFLFKTWKQLRSIARRELNSIFRQFGMIEKVHYNTRGSTEWWFDTPRGRVTIWPVPYGDSDVAAERIQGMSLCAALIDEGVNISEETRQMLISRVSETEHRIILWTTNPDHEAHPFKEFMDDTVDAGKGKYYQFSIFDNPRMTQDLVDDLMLACPEQWQKDRYIHGIWCGPSGGIWPSFLLPYPNGALRNIPDDLEIDCYIAGVDYGARTVTHAVILAVTSEGLWIVDEWRHDSREFGALRESRQVELMLQYLEQKGIVITDWCVDPTETALVDALRDAGQRAINMNCTVEESIECVARALDLERLFIDRRNTKELRREISLFKNLDSAPDSYMKKKPDKKSAKGAHGIDGMRYAVWKYRKWCLGPRALYAGKEAA